MLCHAKYLAICLSALYSLFMLHTYHSKQEVEPEQVPGTAANAVQMDGQTQGGVEVQEMENQDLQARLCAVHLQLQMAHSAHQLP